MVKKILFLLVYLFSLNKVYSNIHKNCDEKDPVFIENLKLIEEDHELIEENLRIEDSYRVINKSVTYIFENRYKYTEKNNTVTYVYGLYYPELLSNRIKYDKSRYSLLKTVSCVVYKENDKWIIKNLDRISKEKRVADFAEEYEIVFQYPNEAKRKYLILYYETTRKYLKNDLYGLSEYINTVYDAGTTHFNISKTYILPKEIKPHITINDGNNNSLKNFILEEDSSDKKTISYKFFLKESNLAFDIKGNDLPYFAFSTFISWDYIARQLYDTYETYLEKYKNVFLNELNNIADKTPLGIFTYITHTYDYVYHHSGTGWYIPNDPNLTIKNKSGDCKDLSFLLTGLYRAAEHTAKPIIIRSLDSNDYDLINPSNNFNHAMVKYYDKSSDTYYYLETTISNEESFDIILEQHSNKYYITYKDDKTIDIGKTPTYSGSNQNDNSNNLLMINRVSNRVPTASFLINSKSTNTIITVDNNSINETRDFCYDDNKIYTDYQNTPDDCKENFIFDNHFSGYSLSSYSIDYNPNSYMTSISTSGLTRTKLFNDKFLVLRIDSGFSKIKEAYDLKNDTYIIPYNESFIENFSTIIIPNDFEIQELPKNIEETNKYFYYSLKIYKKGQNVEIEIISHFFKHELNAEEFEEYKKLNNNIVEKYENNNVLLAIKK